MQTVSETSYFIKTATAALGEQGRIDTIALLASNPQAGTVIPGTGGIRKLRVAASGRGKRGGARVIYYWHSADMPILALAAYTKNTRDELSAEEKRQLAQLAKEYVNRHKRR